MTRLLEVGQAVRGHRVISLHWTKSRGWRGTDAAGHRFYQRGPDAHPDGLYTASPTGVTLSVWPPAPVQQRKRIAQVSATNTRWNAPGRARPDEPLADWCEAAIPGVCTGRAQVRHHIIRRGPGSSDEAWNTLDICGDAGCHGYIHRNITWSKEQGYLRSRPPLRLGGYT